MKTEYYPVLCYQLNNISSFAYLLFMILICDQILEKAVSITTENIKNTDFNYFNYCTLERKTNACMQFAMIL